MEHIWGTLKAKTAAAGLSEEWFLHARNMLQPYRLSDRVTFVFRHSDAVSPLVGYAGVVRWLTGQRQICGGDA